MAAELSLLSIIFVVAFALVGLSVIVKRLELNDQVVKFSFSAAFFLLVTSFFGFSLIFFLGDIHADVGEYEMLRLVLEGKLEKVTHDILSQFGYSNLWAIINFCIAGAGLILYKLSRFVEPPVDGEWYLQLFLIPLALGIILLIGFFIFFEAIALVLGVVATVIGILIGFKKLSGR